MNLLRALVTISGMTMLSRVTGVLREVLIARAFGATAYTDAYNIAFRIPNLLRRLFAEGAFSQAFVPILAEYKNQKGQAAAKELVDHVGTVLTWALLLTCVIGVAASPIIIYVIATGLSSSPDIFQMTVRLTQIMFPYIGFISLVALAGGILNTWREFRIPAFTPVLLNISSIAASLFLAPYLEQPIYALAIAVFVGGVLQLAIQVPALIRIGMLPSISWNPLFALNDAGVRRVLLKMGPAIFAVAAAQISIMINTNIASHLPTGSVSWLFYADRLMEFPTAMLGVALGTILLPSLSKANADGRLDEYSNLLDWGMRLTFLLALPCAVALATLWKPLTATLFHYGKFSATDVNETGKALIAYGVGLIGLISVKILAPGFYAKQDIRTPVKIALFVLAITQAMNVVFLSWLGMAQAGLALSVGLGACMNALLLFFGLRRKGIYTVRPGWISFFLRLAIALCLMGSVGMWIADPFDWLALQQEPLRRMMILAVVIVASAGIYFGSLFAMGFRIKDFKRTAA